jgi:DNA segregation ATPase FtsK/SpoIIIE-like protein
LKCQHVLASRAEELEIPRKNYRKIAMLAHNEHTIEQARQIWHELKKNYPDFTEDPENLTKLLQSPPPVEISLLDFFNVNSIDDIPIDPAWESSYIPDNADWIEIPVGLTYDNRVRKVKYVSEKDGTHALITGWTGVGKSELLSTMMAMFTLLYDPRIVNFVFLDFHSSFYTEVIAESPHCSGSISIDLWTDPNRAEDRILRFLDALESEFNRRRRMLESHNVKNIVEYLTKGFNRVEAFPHLFILIDIPHLFILIDSFEQGMTITPKFEKIMERLLTIDRKTGIHLVLAGQHFGNFVTSAAFTNIKQRFVFSTDQHVLRELLRYKGINFNGRPGSALLNVDLETQLLQIIYTGDLIQDIVKKSKKLALEKNITSNHLFQF